MRENMSKYCLVKRNREKVLSSIQAFSTQTHKSLPLRNEEETSFFMPIVGE